MSANEIYQDGLDTKSQLDPDGVMMEKAKRQLRNALARMDESHSSNSRIAAAQVLIATCYAIQTLQGQHSPPPLFANNED